MVTVDDILESKGCVIWTTAPDDTVLHAIEIMAENNVGALPVIEDGRLVGIISERDYARKVLLEKRDANATLVQEVMTRDVVTVGPEQPIEDCMRKMTFGRFRHLPVVIGDEIIGIISVGDIIKAFMGSTRQ